MPRISFLLLVIGAAFLNFAHAAEDTLAKIKNSQTITLGVRENSRPFSFLDEQKKPQGYSIDLCLAAVAEIQRSLTLPALKVNYKVLSGAERIPSLLAGEIDLECGTTTNTIARKAQVSFSYNIFVANMRVLKKKNLSISSRSDLDALAIGVSTGTTSEKLITQLKSENISMKLKEYPEVATAYKGLKTGEVQALVHDDLVLLGLAAADNALDTYDLSELVLSVEPYAIMMRPHDDALIAIVDRSLHKIFTSGEIRTIYAKWFETDQLSFKMSRLTKDNFTRPNKEPGIAMLLGYSL